MESGNEMRLENSINGDDLETISSMSSSQINPPKARKSKNKKRKFEEEDAFVSKMVSSLDNIVDAMREFNKVLERSLPRVYPWEEVYNELERMGVGPEMISDAYLFLVKNPVYVRALFGYPSSRRMSLLNTMMHKS